MVDIKQLKLGDMVQHVQSGNSYEVIKVTETGQVFAIREIQISNPDEWILVELPNTEVKNAKDKNASP